MTEEEEAMTMMNSKWKFRPPPRGVARESLRLCEILQGGGICRYGVEQGGEGGAGREAGEGGVVGRG